MVLQLIFLVLNDSFLNKKYFMEKLVCNLPYVNKRINNFE